MSLSPQNQSHLRAKAHWPWGFREHLRRAHQLEPDPRSLRCRPPTCTVWAAQYDPRSQTSSRSHWPLVVQVREEDTVVPCPVGSLRGQTLGCSVLFSSSHYLANLNRLTSDEKRSRWGFFERFPGYSLLIKVILHFNYYEKPFLNTKLFRFLKNYNH